MAVVAYQCSVCRRTINLVQNKQGMDWVGNCNITLGCRGQLIQQEVYLDYIRGSLPTDVVGLKNWVQRKVLYNFEQTVTRQTWVITHNLGTLPSVLVYVNVPISGDLTNMVEILPTEIIYDSENQLTLILPKAYIGIAQVIARASNPDILNPRPRPAPVTVEPTLQLSTSGVLTIATRALTTGTSAELPVNIQYTSSAGNVTSLGYIATNVPANVSPWSDTQRVIFKGKVYLVRTFDVQTVSGQLTNGSYVKLTGINPAGPINLTINPGGIDYPNNAFQVSGDYSLYFTPDSEFSITGTGTINDRPWLVLSSDYDPITTLTSIIPTDTIPLVFPLPATIIQSGSRDIVPNEVIVLLGASPYTIYDKITDSYIDFTAVDSSSTQFDMFFNAGNIFASTTIEETVYPPIRNV